MSKDEHLNEALYYLQKARFHLTKAEVEPGGIDSVTAVLVIVEDERAKGWKARLKAFSERFVRS